MAFILLLCLEGLYWPCGHSGEVALIMGSQELFYLPYILVLWGGGAFGGGEHVRDLLTVILV